MYEKNIFRDVSMYVVRYNLVNRFVYILEYNKILLTIISRASK